MEMISVALASVIGGLQWSSVPGGLYADPPAPPRTRKTSKVILDILGVSCQVEPTTPCVHQACWCTHACWCKHVGARMHVGGCLVHAWFSHAVTAWCDDVPQSNPQASKLRRKLQHLDPLCTTPYPAIYHPPGVGAAAQAAGVSSTRSSPAWRRLAL